LKALNAFNEVLLIANPTNIERDAAIQRFEFSFERAKFIIIYTNIITFWLIGFNE